MYKKKLIEVALPLEAIDKAAAREKSIRHGYPSTLHLWWARRPLAAARTRVVTLSRNHYRVLGRGRIGPQHHYRALLRAPLEIDRMGR